MKRRLALSLLSLALVLVCLAVYGEAEDNVAVNWQTDAETAWRSAKSEHKPLLLYMSMDNCVFCRKMERTTFADQAVAADIEAGFIAANVAAGSHVPLVRKLRVRTFPTTVIISPTAGVVAYIRGYVGPEQFRTTLAAAVKPERTTRR